VHRSDLKNADYNPRKIDKRAREKLRKNLKTVGLVEPITWNEITGNIVSGHQRVSLLDDLEGRKDYTLDVAVVRLDPHVERQQNVFMNNPSTQGDYDLTALATLLKQESFKPEDAGFDRLDLEVVFSDNELGQMFKMDDAAKAVMTELAGVGGIKAGPGEQKPGEQPIGEPPTGEPADDDDDSDGDEGDDEPLQAEPGQRRSDAVKEFMNNKDGSSDTETYAVVVFTTRREREIFMAACGQDENTRYIDGVRVFSKLGIDPNDGQWAQAFDQAAQA
jgi:hypothetical protein